MSQQQDQAIELAVDVIRKAMLAQYAGVDTPDEIKALDKAAESEWAKLRPALRTLVEEVTTTEYKTTEGK